MDIRPPEPENESTSILPCMGGGGKGGERGGGRGGGGDLCTGMYLIVNVGVAHKAPHGEVGQGEDHLVTTALLVDQHVLVDIATAVHLCGCVCVGGGGGGGGGGYVSSSCILHILCCG